MNPSALTYLRCPACMGQLTTEPRPGNEAPLTRGKISCSCGLSYLVEESIPNLIYPEILLPSDEEFKGKYDSGADNYDLGMDWLFQTFNVNEQGIRSQMVDLMELAPGAKVLDVGCGTGGDSLYIAEKIGPDGLLFSTDISSGMLGIAHRKLKQAAPSVHVMLSNASYLPFPDDLFDAVLHFGGINNFGEIKRALSEMTRVVRPGGKVVIGDESVPPWLRDTFFGKVLMNANPLYKHLPPMEFLPENARQVCLRWFFGDAFYLIDYRVGEGPPPLDIDVPIPGKGDSLRSRFEKTKQG